MILFFRDSWKISYLRFSYEQFFLPLTWPVNKELKVRRAWFVNPLVSRDLISDSFCVPVNVCQLYACALNRWTFCQLFCCVHTGDRDELGSKTQCRIVDVFDRVSWYYCFIVGSDSLKHVFLCFIDKVMPVSVDLFMRTTWLTIHLRYIYQTRSGCKSKLINGFAIGCH